MRWRDVGSEGFTWGDAWAIANAPAPGSALFVAMSRESSGWSADTYVMADLIDAISRVAYYAEGQATGKKPRTPKPYPRPGVKPVHAETKTFGYKPMPVADMRRLLGWDKPAVVDTTPRPCCLLPAPCKHRS